MPSRVFSARTTGLQVGFIGVGSRARWLRRYIGHELPKPEIVLVADRYLPRCYGKDPGLPRATPMPEDFDRWSKYQDYRQMFEKEKLDAVWIETTTHARALVAIDAMQAGLEVDAEKPICLTIEEGRALVTAARRYNRVFQPGSQQRLMPINRYASELVRAGKIGKIQLAVVCNYLPGLPWTPQFEQSVPRISIKN